MIPVHAIYNFYRLLPNMQVVALDIQNPAEAAFIKNTADSKIGSTKFRVSDDDDEPEILVSTVLLPMDHGFNGVPMLFETMVFGGEHNEAQFRYSTYKDALHGHDQIVKCLKKKQVPFIEPNNNWLEDYVRMFAKKPIDFLPDHQKLIVSVINEYLETK